MLASEPSSLAAPAVSCGYATLHFQAFTFSCRSMGLIVCYLRSCSVGEK